MPERDRLEPDAPWTRLVTTEADWDAADPGLLTSMLSSMGLIRAFEEFVLQLASEGLIHGPAHSSIGQEGGAVGSILPLTSADTVNGSHRGHHQFLAKVLGHLAPGGIDPTQPISPEIRHALLTSLAEIAGLDRGFSHGRGGSMHLKWDEAGAIGTNAIVGGGVPLAAGSAWAHRHAGTDAVAVTYFGDGAANIGSTLETFNLAGAWDIPVCFFIENNQYAVSTKVTEVTAEPRLSARGPGFGISSWKVDGMDPLAVYLTMQEALAHMRGGHGPAVIEADVYRYFHQNGPFPGSAFRYRYQGGGGRVARARPDRPGRSSPRAPRHLGPGSHRRIQHGREGPHGGHRRRAAGATARWQAWPTADQARGVARPDFVDVGVRGDLARSSTAPGLPTAGTSPASCEEMKFIDAVAEVMHRRMELDESIVIMGEDIHRLSGGTNGATKGLKDAFPDRVLGTPISENAFTGLAGGIALDGRFRPVVEFMYADFMWVAADQLFNQIGKARHMFGGTTAFPWCYAARWRRAPATAPSTRWTRPASSPRTPGGGSWRRRRPSTTSG